MIKKFVSWLEEQVGSIYVWGGQGEVNLTEEEIRKMETSKANADRVMVFYNKQKAKGIKAIHAYDCSGLIVRFLLDNGLIKSDTTSAGLYKLCDKITEPLQEGDFVFRHNGLKVHHVGVYVGDGFVIHAKGRDVGVVKEPLNANGNTYWNRLGRYAKLQDKKEKQETGGVIVELSVLRNGSRGNEVKSLQILLNGFNFDCGKVDGVFGTKTEGAVKAFQKANRLKVDGIVGKDTWTKLLKGEEK